MSPFSPERQLLLGLLGLQCALITRDQLVAAFSVWTGHKDRELAEILVEQNALTAERRTLLTALVEQHLQQHGNDPEQSLRQLSSIDSIRDDLHQLADPEVQISLATVGAAKRAAASELPADDPFATVRPHPETQPAGGRFVVVQPLARGALGSVSIAKDLELNRHVAFKQILPDIADNLDAQIRFKREAEITGGLEHPGIVPIYGLGNYENGRPFYAMKLIRGDSLKEAIARFHADRKAGKVGFDSLEFRNLLRRMIDVCNAIQYAHDRGVLHRDLKPGNIMLGQYGETLVVDWGLAKPLAEESPEKNAVGDAERVEPPLVPRTSLSQSGGRETQAGTASGTPAYMSPEQARGDLKTLGPATDIYALGATLFSVLTGQPPITADSVGETIQKAAKGDLSAAQDLVPSVPRPLDAICRKALAYQSSARYPSAKEVAADLERWLADEPITATPESTSERLGRITRKHRTAVVTTLAASVLLALGSITGAIVINGHKISETSARQKAEKLAKTNGQLAAQNEDLAKDNFKKATLAEKQSQELVQQNVELTTRNAALRSSAYSAQVKRASLLAEKRPAAALAILYDEALCPSDLREFTWGLLHRACQRTVHTLTGHAGRVHAVAFSPDGRILASGSEDQGDSDLTDLIKLWDVASGKEQATLVGHANDVYSLAFAPDGRTLASASADATIRLWDLKNDREPIILSEHSGEVNCVAFSPDGKSFATGSDDCTLRLWNVAAQRCNVTLYRPYRVYDLAFAPDGNALVCLHEGAIELYDITVRSEPTLVSSGPNVNALCVTFSPDGRTLAVGREGGRIELWDADLSNMQHELIGEWSDVNKVSFSADGRTLAAGHDHHRIELWNLEQREVRTTLETYSSSVSSIAFSPDGQTLASAHWDKAVRVWNTANGLARATLPGLVNTDVTLSPDGNTIAGENALWDLSSGQPKFTIPQIPYSHGSPKAAFSSDGRTVAIGNPDGKSGEIALIDATDGKTTMTLTHEVGAVHNVAFSTDGRTVASSSIRGKVRLWNVDTATIVAECTIADLHTNEMSAFSADVQTYATGHGDGTITLWYVTDGKPLILQGKHAERITCIAFSPDGRTIASGSQDKTIKMWDVASRKELSTIKGHNGSVECIAFLDEGRTLASGSVDKTIKLWDVMSLQDRATLFTDDVVGDLAVSADSRILISQQGGTVKVWDVFTSQEKATLSGHSGAIASVAFAPDGRTLASGSHDQKIKLWNSENGKELSTLAGHAGEITSVSLAPDGHILASGSEDCTVKLWDLTQAKEVATYSEHLENRERVTKVKFSRNGKLLASSSTDNTRPSDPEFYGSIYLHDIANKEPALPVTSHNPDAIPALFFSPDDTFLAYGYGNGSIDLYSFESGGPESFYGLMPGRDKNLSGIEFSNDGRTIILSSRDNSTIRVGDFQENRFRLNHICHTDHTNSPTLSQDGRILACGNSDGTIKVWDIAAKQELGTLTGHTGEVRSLSFAPDGLTLASGSSDCTVKLWRMQDAFAELKRQKRARLLIPGSQLSDAENRKDWFGTCAHLHYLIDGFPESADFRLRRGRAYAEVNWWPEAIDDYRAAVQLTPEVFTPRHELAWALWSSSNAEALSDAWGKWVAKFDRSSDAATLDLLAYTRLLWPIIDRDEAANVRAWALSAVKQDPSSWSYLETLGAAELRAGNPASSVIALMQSATKYSNARDEEVRKWNERDVRLFPVVDENRALPTLWTRLHLALALCARGEMGEARRVDVTIPESEPTEVDWQERLIWRTLYPELREKLGPVVNPPASAANPENSTKE